MIKFLIIIILVFFYTTSGFGQGDSEITNFKSKCLEILSQNDTTNFDSLNIYISKNKLTIDFLANVNCAQDNVGRVWVSNDTLYIMDNDVKVMIDHKDSSTADEAGHVVFKS